MASAPLLPIIDFSSPDRDGTAKQLVAAMETVGFVYLDNVPGYNLEIENKLLEASKWFFSKPREEKIKCSCINWNKDAKGVYRGYIPIKLEDPSDPNPKGHLREQYEMGLELPADDPDRNSANYLYEPTPFPEGPEGDSFRQLFMSHYSAMTDAGIEFLRLLSKGLGQDENTYVKKFLPKPTSSLRTMHYPTYGDTPMPTFVCEEHFDVTFVTLLVTFSYAGLEICNEHNEWVGVAPRPGSLIVNVGDLLSRMSKGKFKATRHRVRDTGGDRYSSPFFFEPRADAKFELADEKFGTITYGSWVIAYSRRNAYQYGNLPPYPEDLPMSG